MRNRVSRKTRCCAEAELPGTDGNSYQEGSWGAPGKDGVWLAVINTVRSDRSPPGCTFQSDELWGRAWSDNTTLVTCWTKWNRAQVCISPWGSGGGVQEVIPQKSYNMLGSWTMPTEPQWWKHYVLKLSLVWDNVRFTQVTRKSQNNTKKYKELIMTKTSLLLVEWLNSQGLKWLPIPSPSTLPFSRSWTVISARLLCFTENEYHAKDWRV